MAKAMNTVFGIGIAILIFIVAMLGINVFYPVPDIDDFNCSEFRVEKLAPCADNLTVGECNALTSQRTLALDNTEYQECWDRFDDARDTYSTNFFLISNILGFIAIIVSMFLFSMTNIAAGTAFSGLALIVFGFMVGWQHTDDVVKFIISLIITAVVIKFAVIVNRRYDQQPKKKKKK
ncbi:MAG: hypothetical protein GOV00_02925 [Candidatus Altiarchaeota archaeon]|nr:hypothetical protein [Candidatus Altiarchaeota archaeon]